VKYRVWVMVAVVVVILVGLVLVRLWWPSGPVAPLSNVGLPIPTRGPALADTHGGRVRLTGVQTGIVAGIEGPSGSPGGPVRA